MNARYSLLLLFICCSFAAFGQGPTTASTSLNLCGQSYAAPAGCVALTEHELACEGYQLSWVYLDARDYRSAAEQYIAQIRHELKGAKQEPIDCFVLDKPTKGYKITYKIPDGLAYQLLAYSVVNGQPLVIQLKLPSEPISNQAIPAFARQFMRVSN